MTRRPRLAIALAAALPLLAACARAQDTTQTSHTAHPAAASRPGRDTADLANIPPGFGTLRQEDLAVRVDINQLQVKAIPLEESVIRTLKSDSYRALHDLVESRRARMDDIARRRGLQDYRAWYVSFFALQPEVPYSPQEFVIINNGREFRPIEIIPLSAGFGGPRLRQREMQAAIYVFEPALDLQQSLAIQVESTRSDAWPGIFQRVERERAMARSRSTQQRP